MPSLPATCSHSSLHRKALSGKCTVCKKAFFGKCGIVCKKALSGKCIVCKKAFSAERYCIEKGHSPEKL
jgi:hypothetical protein